ncbi:MAG: hypothetical protein LBQ81_12385, partial [Zoogloeaceae bacterium]|jgi:hypothetical protein|nr:hypothetical protein [Zoogloeaceae bacterium]
MYDAARAFGPRVERAYTDPRSQVRIDDARTFFSTGQRQYDAIVSEPSNPWVSGVANLFTVEFYRFLKHHLKEEGVLVQWLHTYELNDPLVATMLAALVSEFPDTEFYAITNGDLLILAPKGRFTTPFQDAPWREAALAAELRRVGLGHLDEIALRRIGSGEVIRQYARLFAVQPHSEYYPEVSLNAPRTRFQKQRATFLYDLVTNGLPVLDILDCRIPSGAKAQVINSAHSFSKQRFLALQVIDAIRQGRTSAEFKRNLPQDAQNIGHALSVMQRASSGTPELTREWSANLSMLAEASVGALPAEDLLDIWQSAPDWLPANVLRTPLAAALMRTYAATAARDPQAMLREAEAVLSMSDAGNLAPATREYLLVIAMLGALGSGDPQKAADLNLRHTNNIANRFTSVRSYLLAWADSGVPACVARR